MESIIKGVIELLKNLGIPIEQLSPIITTLLGISLLFSVLAVLWKITKQIILIRNQRLLNKDLTPYFTRQDVDRATKYFIPTRFQNVSPSEDDESGRHYIASAKSELIPFFLKKAFNNDADSNKYYLILADTGMGKTTFLINLYLQYKNQWKNFSNLTKLHDIALFPLGNPDILEEIEKIENKKNTILLLDAFDEDVKALDNHKERMTEILGKVQSFREIVITCRTQFFPSEEEEPSKTGYYSFGESGEYKFQKLYLSVFDDSDVKKYLRKRFSVFSISKYFKAKEIVKKCPNLIVRPMLLSRINDLIDSDRKFNYTFEIYEELINKWIERESKKFGIREKYGSSENYQTLLYNFSKALALDLYKNNEKRGGYLISKNEEISPHSKTELKLADIENEYKTLSLTEKEARSQSLLNRNSKGQYKFSHKSFLEYFLANEVSVNYDFFANFNFEGMSAAQNFAREMAIEKFSHFNGECKIVGRQTALPIDAIDKNDIGKIVELKILEHINNLTPLFLVELKHLKKVTIYDTNKFRFLYLTYSSFYWLESLNLNLLKEVQKNLSVIFNKTGDKFYKDLVLTLNQSYLWDSDIRYKYLAQQNLQQFIKRIKNQNFKEFFEEINWEGMLINGNNAYKDLLQLRDNLLENKNDPTQYGSPENKLKDNLKLLNCLMNNKNYSPGYPDENSYNLISHLKTAEPFLKLMNAFQDKHPECKMYY